MSDQLVRDVMSRFKEVFLSMWTSQQMKQLIHLLISKITMNKEREIDSIEIQINNEYKENEDLYNEDDKELVKDIISIIAYDNKKIECLYDELFL